MPKMHSILDQTVDEKGGRQGYLEFVQQFVGN